MFGISWDQISGLIQRLLMFGGGIAVGKGWISEEMMYAIIGSVMSIGGILWGVKVNTATALVQSVAAMDEVKKIVMENTTQGNKVNDATISKVVVQ